MQSTINGVKYSAKYRYKQFDSFHNRMQTTYAMSQSRYSIPNFPNKTVKLIYDHGQEHFLQDRLFFLSRYMRGIVCVPKANINPDLLQFLKGEWKTSTERKLEEQNQQ